MVPTKQKPRHYHRSSVASATSPPTKHGLAPPPSDDSDIPQEAWRTEVISGGSLKPVDLDTGTNGWASPPGDLFSLRSQNFFSKKTKSPSGQWLLQPAGVDWLRSNSKLDHYLSHPENRIMNTIKKHQSSKTFVIAVNLQIPGKEQHSAVFYFASSENTPIQPGSLLYNFIHGDDTFRNSRFKIVNRIVKGPWIVKTAVGSHAACLLGKALNCYYHKGDNYLEIDVDIGSSAIASAILHLALGYVTSVTIDMGFLVEAQTEEELPEKLFGGVRICQMEMSSAKFVETASLKKGSSTGGHCCSGSKVEAQESKSQSVDLLN